MTTTSISVEKLVRPALSSLYHANSTSRDPVMLSVVSTGAGSVLPTWLFGQSGASSTILSVSLPYSRHSILDCLHPSKASALSSETSGFCSAEMSAHLAEGARNKGLVAVCGENGICAAFPTAHEGGTDQVTVLGVGVSAAISTGRKLKSGHRCFVCVEDNFGQKLEYEMKLDDSIGRTRQQEDELCAYLTLNAIFDYCNMFHPLRSSLLDFKSLSSLSVEGVALKSGVEMIPPSNLNFVKEQLAGKVLSNEMTHMVLHPFRRTEKESLGQVSVPFFPFEHFAVVVLSGSFNPLHLGHEALLNFAADYVSKLHNGEKDVVKMFEISVKNVDKGTLSFEVLKQRLDQFVRTSKAPEDSGAEHFSDFNNRDGPYTLALTNQDYSRFVEKSYIMKGSYFCVGFDTAVRLIDPKYYNQDKDEMLNKILEMKQNRVKFIVFGRKNKSSGVFEDFSEQKQSLPVIVRSMFHVIPEKDFRFDLSSTEVRNKSQ